MSVQQYVVLMPHTKMHYYVFESINDFFKFCLQRDYEEYKVRVNALVAKAQKTPEEGWTMQDGTPWPGNNTRDHPGMIQVNFFIDLFSLYKLTETVLNLTLEAGLGWLRTESWILTLAFFFSIFTGFPWS